MCIDHQPIVDGVIKADAANLKGIIKNESVDAVVHCLSLWGPESSRVNYFNEDYRILKPGCRLYIVEPAKSYDKDVLIDMVCSCGFELREYNEVNDGMHTFMYIEFNKLI